MHDAPATTQRPRAATLHPARRPEVRATSAQALVALVGAAVVLALVLVVTGFAMGRATRSVAVVCDCRCP